MWPEVETTKAENKRELKLSGAAISERLASPSGLDRSIFDLTMINLLNISDTTLQTLPAEISNLTNLQTILLYGNQLEALPASIGTLDKLKVLDVSRNRLKSVPAEIAELTNLAAVNVSNNQLESFPALVNCSKLGVLDISYNQLTEFPDVCVESMSNLSDINLKSNQIVAIPNEIAELGALKHLNLASNKVLALPKVLAAMSKLKELLLEDNPMTDKRLYKLVLQCRTKQILDYVKQHGTDAPKGDAAKKDKAGKSAGGGSKKKPTASVVAEEPSNRIVVQRHTDDSLHVVHMDTVKDVRPHILCCIVKNVNLEEGNFKRFLQIQSKLHDTVCGKRELSTIATHDLDKIKGGLVRYTARTPKNLHIIPLGKSKRVTGLKLFENLKAEAEALRKEKKRSMYSGIHKYLYLLDKQDVFSCLEDGEGNVISLPPLTNGELTKISTETKNVFIEVTSSASINDCRTTIHELLKEMLLAGFGGDVQPATVDEEVALKTQIVVQQVKSTDVEGNLRAIYPSKNDLLFEEDQMVLVHRE